MRKKSLTPAELAILGIIGIKPCYGYEIDKLIEQKNVREWVDIGFSSIYALLKKLEQQELISSHLIQEGNTPPRKIYSITKKGRDQLTFYTKSWLGAYFDFRSTFDVALGNIQHLHKMDAMLALKEYDKKLDESIQSIKAILDVMISSQPEYHLMTIFQRNLVHLHAEKKWLANLKHQVWEKHEKLAETECKEDDTTIPSEAKHA